MENFSAPIPAKRYFTISEASDLCGVKPHVLRYWEQEFTQLRPMKRRGNRRYYQRHEVLMIRKIRELLYDKGFTIIGARNVLLALGPADLEFSSADSCADLDADEVDPVVENFRLVPDLLLGGEAMLASATISASRAESHDNLAVSDGLWRLVEGIPQDLQGVRKELLEIRDLLSLAH